MYLAFNGTPILILIFCKNLFQFKGRKGIEIIYKPFKNFFFFFCFSDCAVYQNEVKVSKKKYAISVQQLLAAKMYNSLSKELLNLFSILFRTVGIEPNYVHKVTQLSKAAPTATVICYNHNVTTHWRQPLYSILKFFIARCSLIISG